METKWHWSEISIRDKQANPLKPIKALTNGVLAIHPTPYAMKSTGSMGYTVTHCATGGEIRRGLTFATASKLAKALAPLAWQDLKSHTDKKTLNKLAPDVNRICSEICGD